MKAEASTHDRIRAASEAIWQRSLARVTEQIAVIEGAVMALLEGRLDEAMSAEAEREAHKIAGSAGTFGFHQASATARELENLFADRPTSPAAAAEAAALVDSLHAGLMRRADEPDLSPGDDGASSRPSWRDGASTSTDADTGSGSATQEAPVVLVVGSSGAVTGAVSAQLRARGLAAQIVDVARPGASYGTDSPPKAAVIELSSHDSFDPYAVLRSLGEQRVPTLALVAKSAGTAARVSALGAGAQLLLDVPDTPAGWAQFAETVTTLVGSGVTAAHRILAVDDDETILAVVKEILTSSAVADVVTLSDPERFWSELNQLEPELVLLDIDMPTVSGIELCRLVRSHPRWQRLPVVMLSSRVDHTTVERVYAAGADDFVGKPVVAAELRARVTNRLERTRLHRQLAETDPLTGLANRRRLEADLRRLQDVADRRGVPLCLAVVELDQFKSVNDRYGHSVGDEVLRRAATHLRDAFRGDDAVARMAGEQFVLATLGIRLEDAVARLGGVLDAFGRLKHTIEGHALSVGASAGIAQHRRDGSDFGALYRAADAALVVARSGGPGMVLPTGPGLAEGRLDVDVTIVEDDEIVAELLLHTLTTLGHRCTVLNDGAEAIDRLTDRRNPLRTKVILLDIDLPGRNGFEVLQALHERGVTRRSSVLVVSARSSEDETLRALRSGASDHIAKPFSVPLLVQKVHRLLAEAR